MERKSDTVRRLVSEGNYKKALLIAKDFRLGIGPDQRDAMSRAYECMVRPSFYSQIGINPHSAIEKGVSVLTELYGQSTSM